MTLQLSLLRNLRRHYRTIHNDEIEGKVMNSQSGDNRCPICDKVFKFKYRLTCHIEKVHEKRTMTCDICKEAFSNKIALHNHKKFKHNMSTNYACTICDKTFYNSGTLKRHLKVVHEKIIHMSIK